MKKRFKMSKRASRKTFRRGAMKMHRWNDARPMRGGIRL